MKPNRLHSMGGRLCERPQITRRPAHMRLRATRMLDGRHIGTHWDQTLGDGHSNLRAPLAITITRFKSEIKVRSPAGFSCNWQVAFPGGLSRRGVARKGCQEGLPGGVAKKVPRGAARKITRTEHQGAPQDDRTRHRSLSAHRHAHGSTKCVTPFLHALQVGKRGDRSIAAMSAWARQVGPNVLLWGRRDLNFSTATPPIAGNTIINRRPMSRAIPHDAPAVHCSMQDIRRPAASSTQDTTPSVPALLDRDISCHA